MKKSIIISGIVLGLISAVIVWKISFKEASNSVEKEKLDYSLNAGELQQEFEMDENSANTKYLNKVISVTGVVSAIEKTDNGINVTLKNENDLSGVICGFQDQNETELNLTPGSTVSIKGLCTGYLFDVILVKCVIEKN